MAYFNVVYVNYHRDINVNEMIRHLSNGDFEVIYTTPEEIANQEEYTREREQYRDFLYRIDE